VKTVVIIQARLGSKRLPGKVLQEIAGKPMLWHVVERMQRARGINDVMVATTDSPLDDRLAAWCTADGVPCFRGSEANVLDRYCGAARAANADVVVRITSDCPLIDPAITTRVVDEFLAEQERWSGASNVIHRTWPRGLDTEVVARETLDRLQRVACEPRFREHVTLYMYEHSDEFPLLSVENNRDRSAFRWTVDEEADLQFVRAVYERLYSTERVFGAADVFQLLEQEPRLAEINRTVQQKKV
jgi:spore coat polysaccharide biosynthesis protein SpsF